MKHNPKALGMAVGFAGLHTGVGIWVTILGLLNTFVICWLFGALVAVVYNGAVSQFSIKS